MFLGAMRGWFELAKIFGAELKMGCIISINRNYTFLESSSFDIFSVLTILC